jgi:hypothetical protein
MTAENTEVDFQRHTTEYWWGSKFNCCPSNPKLPKGKNIAKAAGRVNCEGISLAIVEQRFQLTKG